MVARINLIAVATTLLLTLVSSAAAIEPTGAAVEPAVEPAPGAKTDRYALPEGGVKQLLTFIDRLKQFRPRTSEEFVERNKRLPTALQQAAEKILEIEGDNTLETEATRTAKEILLSLRVQELQRAKPVEQKQIVEEIEDFLASAKQLSRNELSLALAAASRLEQIGNTDLASAAYGAFGDIFSEQDDEFLADYGAKMHGVARRLDLPGNDMVIVGKTVDGADFEWESYRGKVVLVDFWATWCRPCVRELPHVKKQFEQYHERGFEVVGISLDRDRNRLEKFIQDRELPWVTLFEDGAGWQHPMATYYGVMGIPMAMLVDREGHVLSLSARGPQLDRQLAELMGPPAKIDDLPAVD